MRGIRHEGGSQQGPAPARLRSPKKRAPIKKSGRPFWRQPVLLGLIVLLLGSGGAGGWWAWREGWLVEARNRVDAIGLAIVGAVTPFKLVDVTVEGRDYVERSAILGALGVKAGIRCSASTCRPRARAQIDRLGGQRHRRGRLPDTLYVVLVERRAVAIWQNGDEYTLIDRDGRTVRASRMPPGAEKLLLLGGPARPSMSASCCCFWLRACDRPRVRSAVWVGQRRWNLVLNNGVEIWLPEEDAVAALSSW